MPLENLQSARALHEPTFLTAMSLELHVTTRQRLRPDPEFDAVAAAFFVVSNDIPEEDDEDDDQRPKRPRKHEGILVVDSAGALFNWKKILWKILTKVQFEK